MDKDERIRKLEELVDLLSPEPWNQDGEAIDRLQGELWPESYPASKSPWRAEGTEEVKS